MTKKEFIELFWVKMNGGSPDMDIVKKYPKPYIDKFIMLGMNAVMFDVFKDVDNYDTYAKWYPNIDVSKRSDGLYESTLPVSLVQTKLTNNSVLRVTMTNDFVTDKFLYAGVNKGMSHIRQGTAGRMGIILYNVNDNKVVYLNHDSKIPSVNMFLIRPFEDYGDNDDLQIPQGQEDNLLTFVTKWIISNIDPNTNNSNADM